MTSMLVLALLVITVAMIGVRAIAWARGVRWLFRRSTLAPPDSSGENTEPGQQCDRCGYDMSRAPVPRCPECGALLGFSRSPSELGIDEEELPGIYDSIERERAGESDERIRGGPSEKQ